MNDVIITYFQNERTNNDFVQAIIIRSHNFFATYKSKRNIEITDIKNRIYILEEDLNSLIEVINL